MSVTKIQILQNQPTICTQVEALLACHCGDEYGINYSTWSFCTCVLLPLCMQCVESRSFPVAVIMNKGNLTSPCIGSIGESPCIFGSSIFFAEQQASFLNEHILSSDLLDEKSRSSPDKPPFSAKSFPSGFCLNAYDVTYAYDARYESCMRDQF